MNNAIVKIAQTFRTGTNDIDTLNFIHMYLNDENQISPDHIISQFYGSLEIWPTLVEIYYFYKDKKNLLQIRVKKKGVKVQKWHKIEQNSRINATFGK